MKILELQILKNHTEISQIKVRWTVEKVSLGRLVIIYRLKTLKLVGLALKIFGWLQKVLVLGFLTRARRLDAEKQFNSMFLKLILANKKLCSNILVLIIFLNL